MRMVQSGENPLFVLLCPLFQSITQYSSYSSRRGDHMMHINIQQMSFPVPEKSPFEYSGTSQHPNSLSNLGKLPLPFSRLRATYQHTLSPLQMVLSLSHTQTTAKYRYANTKSTISYMPCQYMILHIRLLVRGDSEIELHQKSLEIIMSSYN